MKFVQSTLIGGIIFLTPLVVIAVVLAKAFEIAGRVARPLTSWLPADTVLGVALLDVLAIALVLLVCFLAGLFAQTAMAARWTDKLESSVLSGLPAYGFVKGLVHGLVQRDDASMQAVLVRFDDYSQVAFEIERIKYGADGIPQVVVFLPGSPNAWSGNVCVVDAERVTRIDASMVSAVRRMTFLGRGTAELVGPPPDR